MPSLCVLVACALVSATAQGQSVAVVSRGRAIADAGTGGAIALPINPADCQAQELWTFEVRDLPEAVSAPEYWISTGSGCNLRTDDGTDPNQTCFPVCPDARTAGQCVPRIDSVANGARVQIPANLLVDPHFGRCSAVSGPRYIHLRSNGRLVARSTTPVRADLVAPAAPAGFTAARANTELAAALSWSYATADSGVATDVVDVVDASTDVLDVVDVSTDVLDASDDLVDASDDLVDASDVVVDAAAAADVTTPAVEPLRGFYLLCDPPLSATPTPALDGGACGASGLDDPDASVDGLIERFACGAIIAPTERNLTLQGLRSGVEYHFALVAEDLAGNRSAVARASGCVSGRAVTDFWEQYRQDGGQATPGLCDARPGATGTGLGAVAPWLAAMLYRAGRRSRRRTTSR